MKTLKVLFVLLILFFTFNATQAQYFRMNIGPSVGGNFNLHTGSDIESGSGFGATFGGVLDMKFSEMIGLQTTFGFYDNKSGSFKKTKTEIAGYVNNQPVNADITTETSASLAYFSIEPMLKIELPASQFYFIVGPYLGFNLEGSGSITITSTLPPQYTWAGTNSNVKKETSKTQLKELLTRFELKLGAGYDFPVSPMVKVSPQVTFGYGLTKVQSDVAWRILCVQATCAVKFKIL